MKVYFNASIVGKKYYPPNYLKIIENFKIKGYQVQAALILMFQIRQEGESWFEEFGAADN